MQRISHRMLSRCLPGLLLGLCACASALAEVEYSLEETVADLSNRVGVLEDENQQLRSMVQTSSMRPRKTPKYLRNLVGRLHVDHWGYPGNSPGINAFETGSSLITPQDRLQLRRARLGIEGTLPLHMLYKLDFEFSEASDPEFRDMYLGWGDLPLLGEVLIGNQKRPYGLDHLNSSNFNVFMERPFVVQAFNRNNRRYGITAHNATEDELWNWRIGAYNLRELQTDGTYVSDHYQLEIAGRLGRSIFDRCDDSRYLHLAVASNYAEPDGVPTPGRAPNEARFRTEPEARTSSQWLDTGVIDGAEEFGIFAVESVANAGRFQATMEYMNLWMNRRPGFGDNLHFHGGYLQLAYFLTDHFQPWNRRLGIIDRIAVLDRGDGCRCWSPALQLAVRWSFADLTDQDILGGVGESITAGFNWYLTPHARLQFNSSYGNISDHAPVDGFTSGDYTTLGTRLMIDF